MGRVANDIGQLDYSYSSPFYITFGYFPTFHVQDYFLMMDS